MRGVTVADRRKKRTHKRGVECWERWGGYGGKEMSKVEGEQLMELVGLVGEPSESGKEKRRV